MAVSFVSAEAVKLILRGSQDGRPASMSVWAVKASPAVPTQAELTSLAGAVAGALAGNPFLGFQSAQFSWESVEARDGSVMRGPTATAPAVHPGTGGSGYPSAVAVKVEIFPSSTVFQFKPSQTFIPGIAEDANGEPEDNNWGTELVAAAGAFVTSINNAIKTVGTYALGSVSKQVDGVPRGAALVSQSADQVVRPAVATQVRRLRRVGRRGAPVT